MSLKAQATKLENLIDPEVLAPIVNKKMINRIKFTGLATVDETLVGRPGTTVTVPSYKYIGDATEVGEGEDIPIAQLSQTSTEFTIKKAGRGVQITDEALLSGYGNAIDEASNQLALAVASKVNKDVLGCLRGIKEPMTFTTSSINANAVADALVKFGEDEFDDDGKPVAKVLFVSPANYAVLRKTAEWLKVTEMGVQAIHSGVVGAIHNAQVIVSADLTDTEAFIVKPGALKIFLKRGNLLERDRDIINESWILTISRHYGTYLYDESKAIKLTIGG